MSNTGYKAYANLEEYYLDNGVATGLIKSNDIGDPDYIAPVLDYVFCPLPSVSPSRTPAISRTPSKTPSVTPSISISSTPQITPSVTPSITITPTITPTKTTTPTPTRTPSVTPSTSAATTYTLTTFALNDSSLPSNATKLQYSTGSSTGPWTDLGPFSGYSGVCTFKGSKSFNSGTIVYVRAINEFGYQYRHAVNTDNSTNCPTAGSDLCFSTIPMNSNRTKAFFISTFTC